MDFQKIPEVLDTFDLLKNDEIPVNLCINDDTLFFSPYDDNPYSKRELSDSMVSYMDSIFSHMSEKEIKCAVINIKLGECALDDPGNGEIPPIPENYVSAIHTYIERTVEKKRKEYRRTVIKGRRMLLNGLIFAIICLVGSTIYLNHTAKTSLNEAISQSIAIIAWVVFWHPVEFNLYDARDLRKELREVEAMINIPIKIIKKDKTPIIEEIGENED